MRDDLLQQITQESELEEKIRKARELFPFHRAGALELHAPEWLVFGVLEKNSLGILYGDTGAGKSFIAIDLAASIASGREWFGKAARQGVVIYLLGEGQAGVARRVKAWTIARGVSLDKAPLFFSLHPANLTDPDSIAIVSLAVQSLADEVGDPVLFIIDTWSRSLVGGDENSTSDTTTAIALLDRLRSPYRAAALVVHHTGHSDKSRIRGSIALKASADFEYRIDRSDEGILTMSCTKSKDTAPIDPISFTLSSVELGINDEEGNPVTSAVLTSSASPEGSSGRLGRRQKEFLEILRTMMAEYQKNILDSGRDPREARVLEKAWRDRSVKDHNDRPRFYEAKKALITSGLIIQDGEYVYLP
jgi:hypothetical protein